jgi:DNA adenine methylase
MAETRLLNLFSEDAREGAPQNPFLKWAGGKTQIVPVLAKHVPTRFGRYLEPFLGGGSLFFHLRPKTALLNDLNEELMITYRVVRDRVEDLVAMLGSYPHSKQFYYRLRSQDPAQLDSLSRAARLIYLNRTCYNGLYRVNKQGRFNVPFGDYKNPTICNVEKLKSASSVLQGVRLFSEDYKAFLESESQAGDFIYLDPPYQPSALYSDFKRYTSAFFYERDQRELAELARKLIDRGCHVLASNSDTPLVRRLYYGFQVHTVGARRNINKKADGRGEVKELVIACSQTQ